MNLNDPQDKELKINHPDGIRPVRPQMSQSGRNVAILILFSALLVLSIIEYVSINAYSKHQQGRKPVLQTGGQPVTKTPIELPPIETGSTPTTMTATIPSPIAIPTNTKIPPTPKPTDAAPVSSTPTTTPTSDGTPMPTISPTSTGSGSATLPPSPTQSDKPTPTVSISPSPTSTPAPTS